MLILTCSIGSKIDGSKSLEDCRYLHILITWSLSSIMLCISVSDIISGSFALPLKTMDLKKSGTYRYVSEIVPRVKASVTRIASLITRFLRTSPSGLNNTFRTGCKASLAEKSLSFFPWTRRFSSLFHLHRTKSMNIQVHSLYTILDQQVQTMIDWRAISLNFVTML
jgi:hypothetical protein